MSTNIRDDGLEPTGNAVSESPSLQDEDVTWVKSYASEVCLTYQAIFDDAKDRFHHGPQLIDRFQKAIDDVLTHGRGSFRAVDEAHNELCIASAILADVKPGVRRLTYEPALPNCDKTIDFRAELTNGLIVFVDVKTIKPLPVDRWDQFERAVQEGWFPENMSVILSKEWLGGEFWHYMFAARSRMLEYTLELEEKITLSKLKDPTTLFTLAFCGDGFRWHEDELEDFVSFYSSGVHRSDDTFALAEMRHIKDKGIVLTKEISRFACMLRPQGHIRFKRLNWNVQPPKDPVWL